jgi:hypothetical protein
MNDEVKEGLSPEEWDVEVKARLNEYIDNMLTVAADCNMATKYYHPEVEVFETHTEYDETKIAGAELRIVFRFVDAIDKDKFTFV